MKKILGNKFLFLLLLLVVLNATVFANTGFKWETGGDTFLKSAQYLSFILGGISIIVLGITFIFGSRDLFHKILPVFAGLGIIGSAGAILSVFGISKTSGLVIDILTNL